MVEELKRLLRLLTPVDWLAAGVVALGLLIALVLDDPAVRLIGVSITLLGAVAFFLLLSQRLGEEGTYSPALRSQAAQLRQTVQQARGGTRLIFDDFAETFADTTAPAPDEDNSWRTPSEEFSDEISGVRIVKRFPSKAPLTPPPTPPPTEKAPQTAPPARIRSVNIPDFMLTPSSVVIPTEPRQSFRTLLERLLNLARLLTPTRTALLFWIDSDRQLLVLEAWQSETPELLTERKKFPIGHDIISQIALGGRAEIVTEIQPTAELELLPYYRQSANTSSFVGVPIILQNQTVGVLCLDSTQPQAYTATTVSLLGHVVLLISGLLQSYIYHYELQQKTQAWEHIRTLWKLTTVNEEIFAEQLCELFAAITQAPVVVICLYSHHHRKWNIAALRAPSPWESLREASCPIEQTLVGHAIHHGEPQHWNADIFPYRLHPDEPPLTETCHAYAIPFCSPTHAYGALYCEVPNPLPSQELELLQTLCEWVGAIAEHRYWNQQLQGGLWFYPHYGIWSEMGFHHRVAEERERIRHLQLHTAFCAIQVDRYGVLAELSPAQLRELVMTHILPILRSHLRPFDVIGSISENILGVLLPGMELTHAQLWAESIRKQVATTILSLQSRRLNVTLSVGITELHRHQSAFDALQAVQTALQKALQKGNTVVLYA